MADGKISIRIEVDGKEVNIASKELDKLEDAGHNSGKGLKSAESSMDSLADSSDNAGKKIKGASDNLDDMSNDSKQATGNVKKFATAIGLVAIGAAAFAVLKSSMDDAISRFDTLNKFPKVLEALGVSAEDSQRAMGRLSDGIDGLPTKLDEISSTAQRMYSTFNDMDKATDSAIALNNALLGSGSSAAQAQRGTEQYLKALQTGKMEMDTWNTLQETMDIGLIKVAESLGYVGDTAKQDLYQALQDGVVSMHEFNDAMIEVGTGTGIMAQLAKENSLGIATSLGNLRNAAARGMADIIDRFNDLSKELTGKDIAQNIDGLKNVVNASFKTIGNVIEGATPFVKGFVSVVKNAIPVVDTLTPAIIGLAVAYGSYTVITKATAAIEASNKVLQIAQASTKGLTLVTQAQMTAQIASTTATKADVVAKAAQTGSIKLSTLALGVMTGAIKVSTAAQIIATAATNALGAAWRFLLGPIGWIVAGIGLLVTGIIAVVKWFKRTTAEAERMNKETEELGESTEELNNAVDDTSKSYQKSQKEIQAAGKANQDLAKKIDDLSKKENKSASEKALLNSYIEELNSNVQDLNLAYDEEADALSMSSEQLQARIDLMKEQETAQEAQSRLTEILKEQAEVEAQLAETNELREEWNQKLDEGSVKSREHKKALEELDEQEETLKETTAQLAEQQKATEEQITTSIEAITEATKNGAANQMIAFEELSESQQQTVENMQATWQEYQDAATEMFDVLSDKSELSVAEMQKNLEENQRIIGEWAEGIATLAERGVDEGLLNKLREAGPESAGHVNALVNASDEELEKLSETFAEGGHSATEALSKSLGIDESGVIDAIGHLVVGAEDSLKEQVESADFTSIGNAVPEGLAEGIKSGSSDAESASKNMADDTTDAAKNALGVNSPSRVFKGIGTNVTEGLVLGINQGTSKVVQAVQRMFKGVQVDSTNSFRMITKGYDNAINLIEKTLERLPVATQKSMQNMLNRLKSGTTSQVNLMKKFAIDLLNPYKNTPSQFRSIGTNAMAGLNQGLNSGGGRAIATARRIANSIKSTMQSALKIHSPSRVMRDDVGRWIPEGIAKGIENNASSVYKALDMLSSNMIVSTPEQAVGANRMAYSSVGGSLLDASVRTSTPSTRSNVGGNTQVIKVEAGDVYLEGDKVGKVIWRPVKDNTDRATRIRDLFRG